MGVVHFLNVNEGDCIWIQHPSKHNTVIDISNGNEEINEDDTVFSGNHHQKQHPVNPIQYLKERDVRTIFRFILTHPDMDHMDGIKALFDSYEVVNFWDTKNEKVMDESSDWGRYNKADWEFYQKIRKSTKSPKTLNVYAGEKKKYFNIDEDGQPGGDGLYILAPTPALVEEANETEEYNDCSYVLLYLTGEGKKIIFAGDSADKTWDYILENHKDDVTDVDVLIAPHHGRKSGGNNRYLDVLNPKLTLFGNAKSEYLNYAAWSSRGLDYITNNQADCVIINTEGETGMDVYVTYETFARERNSNTFHDEAFDGWYVMTI